MAAQGPAAQGSGARVLRVASARENAGPQSPGSESSSPRLPGVSGPEPDMEPQVSGGRRGDDSRLPQPSALTGRRPRSGRRGPDPRGPLRGSDAEWRAEKAGSGPGGGTLACLLAASGSPSTLPHFHVSRISRFESSGLSEHVPSSSFSVSSEMASSPGETVTEAESLLMPFRVLSLFAAACGPRKGRGVEYYSEPKDFALSLLPQVLQRSLLSGTG